MPLLLCQHKKEASNPNPNLHMLTWTKMVVLPSTVNTASLCKCLVLQVKGAHVCVCSLYPRAGNIFYESSCFNICDCRSEQPDCSTPVQ